jgi:anti-anti-sigma factor
MQSRILNRCIIFDVPYKNLDLVTVQKFKQNLLSLYLASPYKDLIIDLKNVQFIDAQGLEALLFAGSLIQEGQGKISLCNVSPFVRQVLMQTRLYRFFDINRSVEESLEFIQDTEFTEMCDYQTLRTKLKTQIA